MFTILFWKAALERALKAASNVVITSLVVGDQILNVFNVDWGSAVGVFAGGFVVSVLMSIASDTLTGNGPSLTNAEVVPDHD
jgi:hypothetical protein